jgi:bifunctional UDP-N-acetylglucosamine pyrophosphorylase/glucosamine-1-phosphate N-acetyltransferase
MKIKAVILAAGEGKRMKSATPKVLHRICGRSLVEWAIGAVEALDGSPAVVVGRGREEVMKALAGAGVAFAVQEEQKGTGHAVMTARKEFESAGCVLVTCGDMPLIKPETAKKLVDCIAKDNRDAAVLYTMADDPTGYGRILRDKYGDIKGIVEHRDANKEQRAIREINTSAYCFNRDMLLFALDHMDCGNDQKEYYLTDAIAIIANMGGKISGVEGEAEEGLGVNDRAQLAQAAVVLRARINRAHMLGGVTLVDPENTYIDFDVKIGRDTVIYPGNVLESGTAVGEGCTLYPNNRIAKSSIGDHTDITSSVILETIIGDGCHVGPFAYTRPGSRIGNGIKVGDFVEIKNSNIGDGTKISHLTYVGDADVGRDVNLGCGVVFVNYDGRRKYRTTVEDGAFIGCNTNLVAPVKVGRRGYTAAGSTITQDVPEDALAIARSRQTNKEGWAAKRREEEDK